MNTWDSKRYFKRCQGIQGDYKDTEDIREI